VHISSIFRCLRVLTQTIHAIHYPFTPNPYWILYNPNLNNEPPNYLRWSSRDSCKISFSEISGQKGQNLENKDVVKISGQTKKNQDKWDPWNGDRSSMWVLLSNQISPPFKLMQYDWNNLYTMLGFSLLKKLRTLLTWPKNSLLLLRISSLFTIWFVITCPRCTNESTYSIGLSPT